MGANGKLHKTIFGSAFSESGRRLAPVSFGGSPFDSIRLSAQSSSPKPSEAGTGKSVRVTDCNGSSELEKDAVLGRSK